MQPRRSTWPPYCGQKQTPSAATPASPTLSGTCKHPCADERSGPNPYLSVTHQSLGLNPDANIDFDLYTIGQAYERARLDRSSRTLPEGSASLPLLKSAAACQRGDFLAGFSLGDAPGFDDWVAIQREVWHRRLGLILDRLFWNPVCARRVYRRHGDRLALDCPGCAERNCLSP